MQSSCHQGGIWGQPGYDGGQGEAVRVPFADGTLVPLQEGVDEKMIPTLLTLCDVMCTGHHAAVRAEFTPDCTVAVIGDGAVGLCAVLAARRLGAARVIILGRHPYRIAVAARFGATDSDLPGTPDGYAAMHERNALKALIRI